MPRSNYDKRPFVHVAGTEGRCVESWSSICRRLIEASAGSGASRKRVITVECYTGVFHEEIAAAFESLGVTQIFRSTEAFYSQDVIDELVAPFNGGTDPVFGWLTSLRLAEFLDPAQVSRLQKAIDEIASGVVVVLGTGASLIHPGDVLVYADLPRWTAQCRMRRNEISNLGVENRGLKWSQQYKRAFFTDWRVCDRLKRELMPDWDFVLDTTEPGHPKLADGDAVNAGLKEVTRRPFRVVPFFDPAPWGGQWMKEVCDLDRSVENFGWCFDCVPEENSLLLEIGDVLFEIPAINVVFCEPRALLGEQVYSRFGAEFPIRFDLLDTIDGGHLSFQVHPLTDYIQQHFGMHYTQDESYYLLDAGDDAVVYLGTRDDIDSRSMSNELKAAERGEQVFDDAKFLNSWPAQKHDHFLIPAGTCHCSGANAMVLEISATPYIFTFKMWDWGRLGLDGAPRPVHLEHGLRNIQWDRTTDWVRDQLINQFTQVAVGDGWTEERTGLHELEFIETRRHWFTEKVSHDTCGGVNVLNLVEGREAIVESPTDRFAPFVVHYAETFIVPADVGAYTIRPHGEAHGTQCATMKAFVRS